MRRHFFKIMAASAAILAATTPNATIADPKGSGALVTVPPAEVFSGALSDEDAARLEAERVAACVVNERRAIVLKALALEPWQPTARRMLESALDARCLDHAPLVMPADGLRGAYFQELYRERFMSGPPTLPSAPIDFGAGSSADLSVEAKMDIALRVFADCVAHRDLSDAHALILSAPGTLHETYALRALMPHFSACLVQGSQWTLNKSAISGLLSEVIYRQALSPMGTAVK